MVFSHPRDFKASKNTITRTEHGLKRVGTAIFEQPISAGIVSMSISISSLPPEGSVYYGLVHSKSPSPNRNRAIGQGHKGSIGISSNGSFTHQPIANLSLTPEPAELKEGDEIRIEIDNTSNEGTALFFVNGKPQRYYFSEIPSPVRFGFSLFGQGTAVQVNDITHHYAASPIPDGCCPIPFPIS
ncbi:hypothetical protein BLNAU_23903 [Blattamonas nauphoetae]|uniref:SPRY domain-containing protein n=1 Tax=Blattamonas nauphoetae TaxID=2049346 RepID=A0ABQ9WNY8_9EUKA|nr:hypothetical protein BLNAU_23903 [Blattamonas nauphoetae]